LFLSGQRWERWLLGQPRSRPVAGPFRPWQSEHPRGAKLSMAPLIITVWSKRLGLQHYAQTLLASGIVMLAAAAQAEDVSRELGPHVHGQGTLAVAIEGNNVQIEFVAPGMDIVGFEHKADTARQKRAVTAALAD